MDDVNPEVPPLINTNWLAVRSEALACGVSVKLAYAYVRAAWKVAALQESGAWPFDGPEAIACLDAFMAIEKAATQDTAVAFKERVEAGAVEGRIYWPLPLWKARKATSLAAPPIPSPGRIEEEDLPPELRPGEPCIENDPEFAEVAEPAVALTERERDLFDRIDGLEADLREAVEVAFTRGAVEWVRLNYLTDYLKLVKRIIWIETA